MEFCLHIVSVLRTISALESDVAQPCMETCLSFEKCFIRYYNTAWTRPIAQWSGSVVYPTPALALRLKHLHLLGLIIRLRLNLESGVSCRIMDNPAAPGLRWSPPSTRPGSSCTRTAFETSAVTNARFSDVSAPSEGKKHLLFIRFLWSALAPLAQVSWLKLRSQ